MSNTRPEEKQKDKEEDVVISRVVKSKTLQHEEKQIVVKAWSFYQLADRSNAAYSDTMSVLISSNKDYILLTLAKERADNYKLRIENVKNNPAKIPAIEPLYIYSFYTLDPAKLAEHFEKINKGTVEKLDESEPVTLLLKQAWAFLEACGMGRLVVIEDNPNPKYFSLYYNPNGPRHVRSSCLNSIEGFGNSSPRDCEGTRVILAANQELVPRSLLANAKLLERQQINLMVREEKEVGYTPRPGCHCEIL